MEYKATITVNGGNPERLLKVFSPELENPRTDRSGFSITKKGKAAVVEISAKDAVALRAANDSIIKLLIVYEKMERVE